MKAGFLVQKLGLSQQAYKLCESVNALVSQHDVDTIVFHDEWDIIPIRPSFMLLQKQHMWSYNGAVVATDIRSAEQLLGSPGPKRKYFYVWNLEWLYLGSFKNSQLANVYQNKDMELIARSPYHANIISKCWKKPSFIIEDFNHNEFAKIFTR